MTSRQVNVRVPVWDVADRLRKALRDADVSVSEMAEFLGVSRNTVGNYINGRTSPDLRTLRLWAMSTDVPLEWLAGVDVGDPTSPSPLPPVTCEYLRRSVPFVTFSHPRRLQGARGISLEVRGFTHAA